MAVNCADPCAWALSAARVACLAYLSYLSLYWPILACIGWQWPILAWLCCAWLSLFCLVECFLSYSFEFDCSLLGIEKTGACDCYDFA